MEWNLVLVAVIYGLLRLEDKNFASIGLGKTLLSFQAVTISFCVAIAFVFFSTIILYPIITDVLDLHIDTSAFNHLHDNFPQAILMILKSWIFAAFAEEVIFRGYIMYKIKELMQKQQHLGKVVATLGSSLAFSFIHSYQGIGGIAYTYIGGIFFSILFLQYKNLYINIFVHGFVNTFFLCQKYYE